MKKSVLIVLGLGLMVFGCESPSQNGGGGGTGGEGGTGGTPQACTDPADCEDNNVCTFDNCVDGECSNLPVVGETECVFMGGPGLCSEGTCAPFCDVEDCSDGNACTQDNCDVMLGTCSNPNEADATACMVGNDPGLCKSGVCEGLCADAGTRCDDNEQCTDDSCNPADGVCSNTPQPGQTCDLIGTDDGICTDQGVCGPAGLCADAAERCTDNANNECKNDTCDPATGVCGSGNVDNDTACANDAGTCQDGTCEPKSPIEAIEFLAVDCELLGNSAALPVDAEVRPSSIAFAGAPVDIVIENIVAIPATLVCGFINPGGFTSAKVANSIIGNSISNADLTSATLNSFLADGSAGTARVSPHGDVPFDFATACGCPNPGTGDLVPPCGTGPGIQAPGVVRDGASQTIPPDPTPFPITPTAAGTVDFTVDYAGLALEIRDLAGAAVIPQVCIGGACPFSGDVMSVCTDFPRGDVASPRIMYDAECNKAQFEAGDCIPFEEFPAIADACKGDPRLPPPPCCETLFCNTQADADACCIDLKARWPTAAAAQQPQLPVSPAP